MNVFFGAIMGFLGWGVLAFTAAWIILGMYESGRRYIDSDDHKQVQREMLNIAIRAALVGGFIAVVLSLPQHS
jgi:hypothetical protein